MVELLTVIAVIAILAGIAVPVVVGMQSKGRETSARADMNAIKMALTQFKADYSVFPVTASGDTLYHAGFDSKKDDEDIDNLLAHLTLIQPKPKGGTGDDKNDPVDFSSTINKKKRKYLDAPAKPVTGKFEVGSGDDKYQSGFMKLDPWGRRYNIALDTSFDKKLALTEKFLSISENTTVKETIVGDIAIYSYGTAEDTDDTDAFLYSWKTNAQ